MLIRPAKHPATGRAVVAVAGIAEDEDTHAELSRLSELDRAKEVGAEYEQWAARLA